MESFVLSLVAFGLSLYAMIGRRRYVKDLETENARLEELLQNREDCIEDMREQIVDRDQIIQRLNLRLNGK